MGVGWRKAPYIGEGRGPKLSSNPLIPTRIRHDWFHNVSPFFHLLCSHFLPLILHLFYVKLNPVWNTLGVFPRWLSNIAIFTFWLSVKHFNPGVYNIVFFCNFGFFFPNPFFWNSWWHICKQNQNICLDFSRVLHLLGLVTEDVYFTVDCEWCHWNCIVWEIKNHWDEIYKSTFIIRIYWYKTENNYWYRS